MDESPEEVKDRGNAAVKSQKYEEAILLYTQAIKMDSANFTLYSNRSFAFLKVHQYYFALEDANETIKLQPDWPKGHFRRAEVLFAVRKYKEASESYRVALGLKPDDVNLVECLQRTEKEMIKEKRADETIPWLGAGIGIVFGVVIVISDYVFTQRPTHPLLMALITILIALIGYAIAKLYRYYVGSQKGFLDPPPDLMDTAASPEKEEKSHARYTKSQARQRYKKGKL